MDQKFQSSFIPKGPVGTVSSLSDTYSRPSKNTFFGYIATALFVISIILAVGVFGYERYLLSDIGTMGSNLNQARTTLQPDTIQNLVKANQRILSTRALLANHTAISPFFDYLEGATLKNVSFTGFTYITNDQGEIDLSMQGQARSYSDVALQSDAFNSASFLKNPVFSDLDLDAKGNVTFTFRAVIDPSIISFQKRIAGMNLTAPVALPVATTTATTTKATTATSTKTTTSTTTKTTTGTTASTTSH